MQSNDRTLFDSQDWVKLQLNIDSYKGSSNNLLAFLHRQISVLLPTLQSYIPPCPSLASQTFTREERVWLARLSVSEVTLTYPRKLVAMHTKLLCRVVRGLARLSVSEVTLTYPSSFVAMHTKLLCRVVRGLHNKHT